MLLPILVAATVVVWTFGEMMLFPQASAYVAEIAPPGKTRATAHEKFDARERFEKPGVTAVAAGQRQRVRLEREVLLADGAIGTLLVSRGANPEQAKSPLNVTDPEAVREVHDDYRDAGARILTTNTWDANRVKLTAHEWSDSLEKINREGVRIARESRTLATAIATIGFSLMNFLLGVDAPVSWLLLRGRCSACKASISSTFPLAAS